MSSSRVLKKCRVLKKYSTRAEALLSASETDDWIRASIVIDDSNFQPRTALKIEEINNGCRCELYFTPAVISDKGFSDAIVMASKKGHIDIVKLLLEKTDLISKNTALQIASGYGHTDIVDLLLAVKGVDPTADDHRALKSACDHNHPKVVKRLLEDKRTNPAAIRSQPSILLRSTQKGFVDILRLLLQDTRIDPRVPSHPLLVEAIKQRHLTVLSLLLKDGRIDPTESKSNNRALRVAHEHNYLEGERVLYSSESVWKKQIEKNKIRASKVTLSLALSLFSKAEYKKTTTTTVTATLKA